MKYLTIRTDCAIDMITSIWNYVLSISAKLKRIHITSKLLPEYDRDDNYE